MNIHPKRNVITRVWVRKILRIDCFEEILQSGDIILRTDGLINYVDLEKVAADLPQNISMVQLAEMLGKEALAAGGSDDITITAARYTGMEKRGENHAR